MNYFKCKQQYLKVSPSSNRMPVGRKCEKKTPYNLWRKKRDILTEIYKVGS